jgi:hypothetical protein
MKYYIQVTTGFREDQITTIPMQEAHKAYYLFKNPTERGVFDCGVALVGRNIQEIKPDWHATMGWNPEHEIDTDDWNEIEGKGVGKTMKELLKVAKQVGELMKENISLKDLELKDAMKFLPQNEATEIIGGYTKMIADKMRLS